MDWLELYIWYPYITYNLWALSKTYNLFHRNTHSKGHYIQKRSFGSATPSHIGTIRLHMESGPYSGRLPSSESGRASGLSPLRGHRVVFFLWPIGLPLLFEQFRDCITKCTKSRVFELYLRYSEDTLVIRRRNLGSYLRNWTMVFTGGIKWSRSSGSLFLSAFIVVRCRFFVQLALAAPI